MKITPLADIADNVEFWRGTRFRQYGIGLNVEKAEDDFYEYMLTLVPGESEYLLLTCVEGYKSGSPLAFVKTEISKNLKCVTASSMKLSMGVENVYLKEVDNI
jgi:hypothetical protein